MKTSIHGNGTFTPGESQNMTKRAVITNGDSDKYSESEIEVPITHYRTGTPVTSDGDATVNCCKEKDFQQGVSSSFKDKQKKGEAPQLQTNVKSSSDENDKKENHSQLNDVNSCVDEVGTNGNSSYHESYLHNNNPTNNRDELLETEHASQQGSCEISIDEMPNESKANSNDNGLARNNPEFELTIVNELTQLQQHRQSKLTFSDSTNSINIGDETTSSLKTKQSKLETFVVKKLCCNHPGIFLALSFGLISSFTSVQIKELHGYSPFLVSFYRNIIRLILTLPFLIYFKYNPFPRNCFVLLVIRSALAAFTGIFRIYAFQKLPIADATVIMYVYPVIVLVLASIFLKEKFGLFHIFTCLLSFAGVTLICQPKFVFGSEFHQLDLIGVAFALASAIVGSFAFIFTKKLGKSVSYTVMAFDQVLMGCLVTFIFVFSLNEFQWPQTLRDFGLVMGLSLFSHLYHFINYKALQLENAGLVGIVRTVEVPLVYTWQVFFYSKTPVGLQILGAVMVMSTTLIILLYKWSVSWKENSLGKKVMKKFSVGKENT